MLRSSTYASSIDPLTKSHVFPLHHNCLSQAYGCSDHYTNAVSHIKGGASQETKSNNSRAPMSDNDHSSPPLVAISGTNLPPEVRELFLNWRPTVPSSWTTPPESESEDTAVSTGSSPIRRDYYQPQTLIPTNLSLHAAHTLYTTDHSLPNNASSEDSFPCPMPEVTTNTPSPDPLPIPP